LAILQEAVVAIDLLLTNDICSATFLYEIIDLMGQDLPNMETAEFLLGDLAPQRIQRPNSSGK
jgi:hypothetical protein